MKMLLVLFRFHSYFVLKLPGHVQLCLALNFYLSFLLKYILLKIIIETERKFIFNFIYRLQDQGQTKHVEIQSKAF
jgi:hypothetical protein